MVRRCSVSNIPDAAVCRTILVTDIHEFYFKEESANFCRERPFPRDVKKTNFSQFHFYANIYSRYSNEFLRLATKYVI